MSLAVLYAATFGAYVWHFSSQKALAGRIATGLLLVSVLVHTFVLGMYTMDLGVPPMAGRTGAVSTFVWMLAIAYLSVELSTDERGIGIFVTPLLVALQGLVAHGAMPTDVPEYFRAPFVAVHVGALLFAYASFALACVIGITYVLLFRELKRRTPGVFFQRLPSLQVLDRMNMRAVGIGWLLLTIGLVGGAVWLRDVSIHMADDPRLPHMTITDPKILMAVITWVVYGILLGTRRWAGLTPRRAAWLSALGFAIVLLNFLPVAYFFARSHNFA
ncbi:cytochrome c biogenesis protein CcsA [Luteitalea sp.]|uniref:cytochrome C assembly family protein n=1 Tax=Luteitalea sp. TaxID=2004800 RepID=UPI0025C6EAE3|nr:cytochrome c biogenesis protein CcsA [Luteitalea sp.]